MPRRNSRSIEIPLEIPTTPPIPEPGENIRDSPEEEISAIGAYFGYINPAFNPANAASIWDKQTDYPNTCSSVDNILGEKCMLAAGHPEHHKFVDEDTTLRWADA